MEDADENALRLFIWKNEMQNAVSVTEEEYKGFLYLFVFFPALAVCWRVLTFGWRDGSRHKNDPEPQDSSDAQ